MPELREKRKHNAEKSAKAEAAIARRVSDREKLKQRLYREGAYDLAQKLEACGNDLHLECINCGHKRIAETRCKKRWCPSCAYFIAAERVDKYRAAAAEFEWPLFVTLTVQNSIDVEGLTRLKAAWGKMRRRKLIREKVKSGIIGYEVTNKGKGWHPHLHALLDCRWLSLHVPEPNRKDSAEEKKRKCQAAADELSRLWADVLGQKTASVKVRRGDANALVEVLKYSCKGSELVECAEDVSPLIYLMQGMRLMTTFGEIRKTMQDESTEEDEEIEPIDKGCQCPSCRARGTTMPSDIINRMLRMK